MHFLGNCRYLKATAGMRLLDQQSRDQIMINTRAYLASSQFHFEPTDARVISGEEEGIYSYISVNQERNTLLDEIDAVGVLDLGGSSTQVTFAPVDNHDVLANFFPLRFKGQNLRLYSHSFLSFGHEMVRLRLRQDLLIKHPRAYKRKQGRSYHHHPCYPAGYNQTGEEHPTGPVITPNAEHVFVGSGDYNECSALAYGLLGKEAPCWTFFCSFAGVYQPRILSRSFVAISGFAKVVVKELGLQPDSTLQEVNAATE